MSYTQQTKEQAVKDIQEECERTNKAFIAFIDALDPVMDTLVYNQIEAQTFL